MRPLVVDVDDLLVEDQIEQLLVPIHKAVPGFKVTAYTVPNRMGPLVFRKRYPWIQFGIHGFEHTFCECLTWSYDEAKSFIEKALDMGYAPMFKPPNWIGSPEVEQACRDLSVLYHHHETELPETEGLLCYPGPRRQGVSPKYSPLHTHILKNNVTDYIETHPGFRIKNLKGESFLNPQDVAEVI